jgi:hypothetical protein
MRSVSMAVLLALLQLNPRVFIFSAISGSLPFLNNCVLRNVMIGVNFVETRS